MNIKVLFFYIKRSIHSSISCRKNIHKPCSIHFIIIVISSIIITCCHSVCFQIINSTSISSCRSSRQIIIRTISITSYYIGNFIIKDMISCNYHSFSSISYMPSSINLFLINKINSTISCNYTFFTLINNMSISINLFFLDEIYGTICCNYTFFPCINNIPKTFYSFIITIHIIICLLSIQLAFRRSVMHMTFCISYFINVIISHFICCKHSFSFFFLIDNMAFCKTYLCRIIICNLICSHSFFIFFIIIFCMSCSYNRFKLRRCFNFIRFRKSVIKSIYQFCFYWRN